MISDCFPEDLRVNEHPCRRLLSDPSLAVRF